MADQIIIPKDTPDWQQILSDTESARNESKLAEQGAKNARDDAEDIATDIQSFGGIDGTVRSESDLPSSKGSDEFYYIVDTSLYYQDTGVGDIQGGWEKIRPGWENASNLSSGTVPDGQHISKSRDDVVFHANPRYGYSSIQNALDDLANGTYGRGVVKVWPNDADINSNPWNERLVFKEAGVELSGVTHNSPERIIHDGSGHTINGDEEDCYITNLWIDHTGNGSSYDAIHLTGNEARLENIGNDFAERYVVYMEFVNEFVLTDMELQGGGVGAIRVETADSGSISGLDLHTNPNHGLVLDNMNNSYVDGTIRDIGGDAVRIDDNAGQSINNVIQLAITNPGGAGVIQTQDNGFNNTFEGSIRSANNGWAMDIFKDWNVNSSVYSCDKGIRLRGSFNTVTAQVNQTTSGNDALRVDGNLNNVKVSCRENITIDGNDNTVFFSTVGDVTVNGDDNIIRGALRGGSLDDNGTGNDIVTT
jgi:hypothetical protein